MHSNQFPLLHDKERSILNDALYYMKMAELKKACLMLSVLDKGKKAELIERIMLFIQEGLVKATPKIPSQSLAKNHPIQPLASSNLMLYGGYKNDLKTRDFFKKLIGHQFHFTAFGIDWLNERWLKEDPPTYQEFADFWIQETARRKREGTKPKDEWMFIRFIQQMKKEEPGATQENLLHAWKQLQAKKGEEGFQLIAEATKILK